MPLTNTIKNLGLKGKLLFSMIAVGILPLLISMILSYVQGNESLRRVIGANFQTLARESASKIDSLIEKEISTNRQTAQHPDILDQLETPSPSSPEQGLLEATGKADAQTPEQRIQSALANAGTQALLSSLSEPGYSSDSTRAFYVTDTEGNLIATVNAYPSGLSHDDEVIKKVIADGVYLSGMYLDKKLNEYAFQIAVPIFSVKTNDGNREPQARHPKGESHNAPKTVVGILHRVYSIKAYFTSSLESIRFGDTGHVMIVDGKGVVIDCPILPSGFHIESQEVTSKITSPEAGWINAFDNGHGSREKSIVGFSPLPLTNVKLTKSTATQWHTFVWQASDELFSPTKKLLTWNSLAATFGMVLIVLISSYASSKIIRPIKKLRDALAGFAGADGKSLTIPEPQDIIVDSKDEVSELAIAFNKMSQDLNAIRKSELSNLEEMEQLIIEMAASETRVHTVMNNVIDGIITIDEKGIIDSFNPAAEKIFGYKDREVIGKNVSMLMPEPDRSAHDSYLNNFLTTRVAKIIGFGREVIAQRKDGSTFYMDLAVSEMVIGDRSHFVGIVRDITQRITLENDLRKLSRAVEQSPSSVMITDAQGFIEYVNPNFIQTSGYSYDEVIGKKPSLLKSGVHPPKFYKLLWDTITEGKEWRKEFCNRKKNGELYWELQSISPLRDAHGKITHYLAVKIDDTERKRAEEKMKLYATQLERGNAVKDSLIEELQELKTQLEISARTDPLTELCNRRGMLEKIESEKYRFERSKKSFSFIIADIDHFKKINDSYGHDGGDFVLKKIAKHFNKFMRGQDIACRWGGEEFLILLPETDLHGATILAEKMRTLVQDETFEHNNHIIRLTMSFGVSSFDENSTDVNQCIKSADECLYKAKTGGRNKVVSSPNTTNQLSI